MDNKLSNDERPKGKNGLLYPELSYKIIGLIYKINDEIGFGQLEKVYSDALEELLAKNNIPYERELYSPIKIEEKLIAKRYLDFMIDGKIIVEVKVGDFQYKEACGQLFRYLKSSGLKLGLIVRFTKYGAKVKRIPCFY